MGGKQPCSALLPVLSCGFRDPVDVPAVAGLNQGLRQAVVTAFPSFPSLRTRDLIRAGVLKEKPLWFDIYNAFPPLREPVFRRARLRYGKAKAPVQDIFYHEDLIRA